MTHNDESHYTTNVHAWLGYGGAEHLEKQLACLQIPSVTKATFIQLARHLGTVFEQIVSDNLLATRDETILQYIDILQYLLQQYNTIRL